MSIPVEAVHSIHDQNSFFAFLRSQLNWPLQENIDIKDATFGWKPEEFGIKPEDLRGSTIMQLRPFVEGQPWGIFFLQHHTIGNSLHLTGRLDVLCRDKQGALWISTGGDGIWRYDPAVQKASHFLPKAMPTKIVQDSEGVFWLARGASGPPLWTPSLDASSVEPTPMTLLDHTPCDSIIQRSLKWTA